VLYCPALYSTASLLGSKNCKVLRPRQRFPCAPTKLQETHASSLEKTLLRSRKRLFTRENASSLEQTFLHSRKRLFTRENASSLEKTLLHSRERFFTRGNVSLAKHIQTYHVFTFRFVRAFCLVALALRSSATCYVRPSASGGLHGTN
jgi:hypothetical protein